MTSWVYRPNHPQANENGMVERDVAGPREDAIKSKSFHVIPDIAGYVSVASGKWVDGRRDRREDLKRTGCREVDTSEWSNTCRSLKRTEALRAQGHRVEHDPNAGARRPISFDLE